jgi:nicotinate-nucleotide adenylyltransferase
LEEYEPSSQIQAVGLLGGTFDPIHFGHLVIAEEVRAFLGLERMVFVPAGEPPHKPGLNITPARHRLAMVQLAIASNPCFALSHVELDRPGPSFLVDTLRLLHAQWGTNMALSFVIGWDSLEELHTWHDPLGILAQLTHLVAVGRPGYTDEKAYHTLLEQRLPGIMQRLLVVPVPQMDISSTDLRLRVAQGRPIKYQTPEPVERYIVEHKLYLDSVRSEGR